MAETEACELPSELIRSVLRETVEKRLNSKKCKIDISSASQAGASNFIGIVHRAKFCKEDENESETNPVQQMIVKVAPTNAQRRELFLSRTAFLREIHMYDNVLRSFREFEQSKGVILEENGFTEYPECYKTIDVDVNECLLLEDLSVRGFTMIDKSSENVTADHVRLLMNILGKYHAISIAMKDQQPEKFNELTLPIKQEIFIRQNEKLSRDYFQKLCESIYEALIDEEDAIVRSKLEKLFEKDAIDIAADCIDAEEAGQGSVISHGDTWQNNVMFRYDQNGKPIEISLLDWQISRYCSPVIDIVYFVFCCTTKELRDAHYDEFLKIFHDSLSSNIRKLGSDPDKLFPFEMLMEHFRKFGKFGLILASALLPLITADKGQQLDLDDMSEQFSKYDGSADMPENPFVSNDSKNRFNERMRGVALDMVRLGYI